MSKELIVKKMEEVVATKNREWNIIRRNRRKEEIDEVGCPCWLCSAPHPITGCITAKSSWDCPNISELKTNLSLWALQLVGDGIAKAYVQYMLDNPNDGTRYVMTLSEFMRENIVELLKGAKDF